METNVIRIGVVQLEVKVGNVLDNLQRAADGVACCAKSGCQLICLPEAFATGLNLPKARQIAEPLPGPPTTWLSALAALHQVHLVAGVLERAADKVYSAAVILAPDGALIGAYRRQHAYSLERHFLDNGHHCPVFDTDVGRIGLLLGYDINFPEAARLLFEQRVEILVCPTQLLQPFRRAVRAMTIARATENCCCVVLASSCGANTLANLTYMANSMIARSPVALAPYSFDYTNVSEIIAEAGTTETILIGDLDLAQLRHEQEENPHYADRLSMTYARSA